MSNETGVIRHEGREWAVSVMDGEISVMECAGVFGLPSGSIQIPPAIHVSLCKLLKQAAKTARGNKS